MPQTGWLKQQKFISSQFWRLEVKDQGVGRVGFFWWLSPWLVDGRHLPLSSHGLPSACVWVLISSSYEDTSPTGSRSTSVASFNLNYLFKGPISKYSHILRYWGLGLQHRNFGGDTIHPITKSSPLVPMNMTLFGNKTFADIIKLRWGCTGLGDALNPVSGVLIKRKWYRDTEETYRERRPCEDGVPQCKEFQGLLATTER